MSSILMKLMPVGIKDTKRDHLYGDLSFFCPEELNTIQVYVDTN